MSSEEALLLIDSELTIFALANGLDLHRNRGEAVNRELEWFRDGMDRGAELKAGGDGRVDISVWATERVGGGTASVREDLRNGLTADELREHFRALVAEAVERANALVPG